MISGVLDMESFNQYDILELLPQRRPFVMVDSMVYCDMTVTKTRLEVRADNIFNDGGHLSTAGICENIAQTCAARIGYMSLASGEPVRLGFIGAISNMQVHRTPVTGETVVTEIKVLQEVFNITLVHAEMKCGDELIAETDLKIALGDEEAKN
ncbi:MAG: pseudouridylate synthase [Bacteroidaceae bacterium]|nr:pseudouridylate synthase [Bacteroidaceae bacterium]